VRTLPFFPLKNPGGIMIFSRIVGQNRAKSFLKQVMFREKMPHAYLFTGIAGIGKTMTAMALSMALNCRASIAGEGCGQCPACRQLLGGNSPDFFCLAPDGQNVKIEQIRELNRQLAFAPVARFRVSVIRKAEAMTGEAANAFLKTLEEPPSGNILVLNTTEPIDLLPTIVSRCQRLSFEPIPVGEVCGWLMKEKGLPETEAHIIGHISQGSPGLALEMLETGFQEKRREWIANLLALHDMKRAEAVSLAFDMATRAKNRQGSSGDGENGLLTLMGIWKTCYRDLLVASSAGRTAELINVDFQEPLKNLAGRYRIKDLVECMLMVDRADREIKRMRNPSLVMENLVLRLKDVLRDVETEGKKRAGS